MDFALYTRIIDEIAEQDLAQVVPLHIVGEPLLYPRLIEAVDYAVRKRVPVRLVTNGSLLRGRLLADLVKSGLPELGISLVTNSEEDYYRYRNADLSYGDYYNTIADAVRAFGTAGNRRSHLLQASGCGIDIRPLWEAGLRCGFPARFRLAASCCLQWPGPDTDSSERLSGNQVSRRLRQQPARGENIPRQVRLLRPGAAQDARHQLARRGVPLRRRLQCRNVFGPSQSGYQHWRHFAQP